MHLICPSCPFQNLSIWPKTHPFFQFCTPKRCTRVQCLVLKNNPNYVNLSLIPPWHSSAPLSGWSHNLFLNYIQARQKNWKANKKLRTFLHTFVHQRMKKVDFSLTDEISLKAEDWSLCLKWSSYVIWTCSKSILAKMTFWPLWPQIEDHCKFQLYQHTVHLYRMSDHHIVSLSEHSLQTKSQICVLQAKTHLDIGPIHRVSKNVLYRVSEKYQINYEPNYNTFNRMFDMCSSCCKNFIYLCLSIAMWHDIVENRRITKMPLQRKGSIP